ncbi:MAG: hypothetical protein C0478_03610 [Planctomyces sp.]|jgi:uncharacterized repeat protein (TIGR01451 family)|nr:hypothetical protein [Planctomyces sp.]
MTRIISTAANIQRLALCGLLLGGVSLSGCTTQRAVTAMRQISEPPAYLILVNEELTVRGQAPDFPADGTAPAAQAGGRVRLGSGSRSASQAIQPAAYSPEVTALPTGMKIEVCPPDRRIVAGCPDPAVCPHPFAQGFTIAECYSMECRKNFPDEYICDGGDRGLPIHYDSIGLRGLETEDTVAEFVDHTGKERVKPSSRVCVYAPRFAAVRSVSVPAVGEAVSELANVAGSSGNRSVRAQTKIDQSAQQTPTGGLRMRSRSSGLESTSGQSDFAQITRLAAHEKLINAFQDIGFFRTGMIDVRDLAVIQEGIQASMAWSREQSPIIAAKLEVPIEGRSDVHAAVITLIDDAKNAAPGELRVVKLADKQEAISGDIVEFVIRFDNIGPNSVSGVRLIDNLTPRLAYVPDSATCTLPGQLIVTPNGLGSEILIWELDAPLEAKTGGVITFKTRVR